MVARDLQANGRVDPARGLFTQHREGCRGVAVDRHDRIADMQRRRDRRRGIASDIAAQAGDDQARPIVADRREGGAVQRRRPVWPGVERHMADEQRHRGPTHQRDQPRAPADDPQPLHDSPRSRMRRADVVAIAATIMGAWTAGRDDPFTLSF